MAADELEAAEDAIVDLLGYVDDLTARRRDEPGDDLVTGLLAAEADGGRLTHDEVPTVTIAVPVNGWLNSQGVGRAPRRRCTPQLEPQRPRLVPGLRSQSTAGRRGGP